MYIDPPYLMILHSIYICVGFKEKVRRIKLEGYALAYVYQDERTPWYAKLSIVITLGYLLSPIDLIPDFIPVLGYLDDLILVPLLILLSIKLIPKDILKECREKAQSQLNKTKQSKETAWWFTIKSIIKHLKNVEIVNH
ncbi:unnamed protein product [Rotaria sordida]|uniref:DUF1232 domain-containing protein n=1 Tax=Rotaria sordida TaxID=392033 RepID=A0A814XHG3_9BILA|nr:unnamed protein product [Rotaria sordida]